MSEQPSKIGDVVNGHAAELALLRIMVMALYDYVPNKQEFLRSFDTMTEDHSVRNMYSALPEAFFQEFESLRSGYRKILIGDF